MWAIARMIAYTKKRSDPESHARFGRTVQVDDDGNPGDIPRGIAAALSSFKGADAGRRRGVRQALYPLSHSQELADALPGCEGVALLDSDMGHGGSLAESAALNELVAGLLERVEVRARS